jgi:hypothetical protein
MRRSSTLVPSVPTRGTVTMGFSLAAALRVPVVWSGLLPAAFLFPERPQPGSSHLEHEARALSKAPSREPPGDGQCGHCGTQWPGHAPHSGRARDRGPGQGWGAEVVSQWLARPPAATQAEWRPAVRQLAGPAHWHARAGPLGTTPARWHLSEQRVCVTARSAVLISEVARVAGQDPDCGPDRTWTGPDPPLDSLSDARHWQGSCDRCATVRGAF